MSAALLAVAEAAATAAQLVARAGVNHATEASSAIRSTVASATSSRDCAGA
jgi:hypothetical protein